jgi:hypothetical protein
MIFFSVCRRQKIPVLDIKKTTFRLLGKKLKSNKKHEIDDGKSLSKENEVFHLLPKANEPRLKNQKKSSRLLFKKSLKQKNAFPNPC